MKTAFPELVCNKALTQRLAADILGRGLAHAYIIEGIKGSGKRTLARSIAAALSCERKNDKNAPLPCGGCPSCRKILSGNSPDVIYVRRDPSKVQMGVDIIRGLREDVRLLPNDVEHKVYIIEDAHTMNTQAQNAFLLTLESPPPYVVFLLLCENSGTLLETVRSRAPKLVTERIPRDKLETYICKTDARANDLRIESPEEFADVLTVSGGSIGRALELLDSRAREPIMAGRAIARDFIAALEARSAAMGTRLTAKLSQKRDELILQLEQIRLAIRDLTVAKKSDTGELCFYSSREEAEDSAFAIGAAELMNAYSAAEEAVSSAYANGNTRLIIFTLAVRCKLI